MRSPFLVIRAELVRSFPTMSVRTRTSDFLGKTAILAAIKSEKIWEKSWLRETILVAQISKN